MTRRTQTFLLLAAAALLAFIAVAIAVWPQAHPVTPDASAGSAAAPSPAAPSEGVSVPQGARAMPFEKKRTALPEDYPLQVPIIDGKVVRAGAPADSMWMYEVECALPAEGVAAWYRRAYEGAAWTVVSQSVEQESAGPRFTLALGKGGATSDVVVESRPAGCLVRTTISVGSSAGGSS